MQNAVGEAQYWRERLKAAERLGELYLSVYCTTKNDWDNICRIHKKICDLKVKGKVLDVGCGYGRISKWFDDYTGMDFSEDFINKAKQLYPDKNFVVGDAKKTDFKDKEFDWAVCLSVKGMIEREMGSLEWAKMEYELKRIAKNILLLEYSTPNEYEVITNNTNS